MGTRASFFVGNPSDLPNRDWLGCIAWDGYPDGDCKGFVGATSAEDFIARVEALMSRRDDFCDPKQHSFPFPWRDDLYLTDYTYAYFDGRVQVTCYHSGWRDLTDDMSEAWGDDEDDELPDNVPAPEGRGSKGPDSILVFSIP